MEVSGVAFRSREVPIPAAVDLHGAGEAQPVIKDPAPKGLFGDVAADLADLEGGDARHGRGGNGNVVHLSSIPTALMVAVGMKVADRYGNVPWYASEKVLQPKNLDYVPDPTLTKIVSLGELGGNLRPVEPRISLKHGLSIREDRKRTRLHSSH